MEVKIEGVSYPAWFKETQIKDLQSQWLPKPGDVFVVSHFPLRGLQRLLVALVEGLGDPWSPGLIDKPHFCDAAASRRGARTFLTEAASWSGRRCFKTHAFPHLFPCRHEPFMRNTVGGTPAKILVLVADPRNGFILWHQVLCQLGYGKWELSEFIETITNQEWHLFGDYFEHALAWAQEASAHPETVKLVSADLLGSMDPKEVKVALEEIAEFLEIPGDRAAQLVEAIFQRPSYAERALAQDELVFHQALTGGHLVEQSGLNLHMFEDTLALSSEEVRIAWRRSALAWASCSYGCLEQLAQANMRGAASTPPTPLIQPYQGTAAHESGNCRPCVFALRGVCKHTAEMCAFCHADGHEKTKRASRKTRTLRKLRARTPSPDWPAMNKLMQLM